MTDDGTNYSQTGLQSAEPIHRAIERTLVRARPCVTVCSNLPTRLNEKPRGHQGAGLCCCLCSPRWCLASSFTLTICCKAMDMNDQNDANEVRPPAPSEMGSDAREQIRDWEFLFWAFLLFGLARLAWLYLYRPENKGFHLGLSCGFVFCGVLGFLMRWVFSPKRRK